MSIEVTKWLGQLGLSEYATVFADNDIDRDLLSELDQETLIHIGISSAGHRLRILKATAALSNEQISTPHPPIAESPAAERDSPLEVDDDPAAWSRTPGERKPVTMLFADITGSTALTEKLDAEETHELLYGATQRMCAAIESNRGTVCRFMGDGVMAMFGAPTASEQHAVDACESALDMQQAIRDYATDGNATGLQIRVGLHSGEVVVLTVGDGDKVEYDASGPTVPIAARMEQSAKPGEIYLTTTTQSLAANRVETEALDPVSVKGISEPVPVFSLRRVRSVEEAVLDTTRTSFVGRRAELNHFRGMLDICIEEGHGQTIYVRGEPGIGKTRLVEEFTTIAAGNGASTHRGLVLPFGVGKGQNAIRSLVRNLLGIAPGGGKDARLLVAQTALSDGRLDPDWAVFLNDLLDLPQSIDQKSLYVAMDNTTRNEGKRAVVSALLSIASKNQPTVVIIEDVHWADALILAHLSTLTQTVADCSALLVMTSRIEGDQLDQSWRSTTGGSPFVAIDLGPLRKQDSIALIGEFIDTSDTLVASCLERAAGNPLFLEQLLRNAQEGTTDTLPDSIQSLVLARIDRLQTGDKKALQAASVIGQRFHPDALSHLLGLDGYNCGELVEHSLVRSEGGEYLFAHALIQESVYGSMLKGRRRELHGKAAEWFTDSDLTLRAQHLDYAGDDRAPGAYLDAAREQEKQSRFEHAIALTKQGLTIASDSNRFELRFLQGKLQLGIGATPESIDTYRKALAEANSDTERCRASIGVAEGLRVAGEYETMQEELASAEVIAMRHELSAELARIRLLQGNAAFFLGDPEAGFVVSTRALDEARAAGSLELEARALSNLGDAEYGRGHMLSAHGFFSRCVKISRECGFGQILPGNLGMLGVVSFFKNDFRTFEDNLRSSIELAKKTRQLRKEMIFSGFLGGNMMEWSKEGALTEAQKLLARQDELALDLGAKDHLAVNRVRRARISLQAGDVSDAESLCHEAIGMYREIGSRTRMSMAFSTLAEATRDTITRRSALKEGEALLPGALGDTYLYFYRDAIEACLRTGEWDEVHHYIQALENYTRVEPLPWSNFFIARGRALAAYGRGEHGDASIQELHRLRDEAKRVRLEVAVAALEKILSMT